MAHHIRTGDDQSVAILKAIRSVDRPGAKLLLIEQIVPNDPGPHLDQAPGHPRAGFVFEREMDTGVTYQFWKRVRGRFLLHNDAVRPRDHTFDSFRIVIAR